MAENEANKDPGPSDQAAQENEQPENNPNENQIIFSKTWIAIGLLAVVFGLGISTILKIILAILVFICGLFAGLYLIVESSFDKKIRELRNGRIKWEAPTPQHFRAEAVLACDPYLTGIPPIDGQLEDILSYILRDYVYPWLFKVTHSNEFSLQLRETVQVFISSFSARVRDVDWIPFITTKLVDDVVNHVRLFKSARNELRLRNRGGNNHHDSSNAEDLESIFFDAEVDMENKQNRQICRDLVTSVHQEEIQFFQDISETLLFLLLPKVDFECTALRTLTRELLVQVVFKPSLDLISDPDFINQNIVYLYKDYPIKPDLFTNTLRSSDSIEELQAARDLITKEIGIIRSNDSKGEEDSTLKQQLNSLLSLRKTVDQRIHRLQEGGGDTDSIGMPAQDDWNRMIGPGLKLFNLPLEVVLKNNIALGFFIDFMTSLGCQAYVYFFLNIEGWKVSSEQQLSTLELERQMQQQQPSVEQSQDSDVQQQCGFKPYEQQRDSTYEKLRESAHTIYEEYLSEKASPRLKLEDSAVKKLLFKIRTEPPNCEWFNEVQEALTIKIQSDERFYDSFKKSIGYVKLLKELDLLRDANAKSEDSSSIPEDDFSIYDNLSLSSVDATRNIDNVDRLSRTSAEDNPEIMTSSSSSAVETPRGHKRNKSNASLGSMASLGADIAATANSSQQQPALYTARVTDVKLIKDGGKTYAVYRIHVQCRDPRGNESTKEIYRRFSDFYALHERVTQLVPKFSKLSFPKKQTFGNTDADVLKTRMKMFQAYLREVLSNENLQCHPELLDPLSKFLDENYEKMAKSTSLGLGKAVAGSVKTGVKNVSSAVTAVPGQLINTVDNVVDGIAKAFVSQKPSTEAGGGSGRNGGCESSGYEPGTEEAIASRVSVSPLRLSSDFNISQGGHGLNASTNNDNIPLRIMLLFMDEVFDLKERNQWLRRYIVSFLRQILKAIFGDLVNRRIMEYFAYWTSPSTIGYYIKVLKDSLWPNGYPAAARPPRDESTKMRTRLAAKMALNSSLSDELKRAIGSETSRSGLQMILEMLQHPVLNKRLILVIFEAVLDAVFQEQNFPSIFQRLYSRSGRLRNDLKNAQRKQFDKRTSANVRSGIAI